MNIISQFHSPSQFFPPTTFHYLSPSRDRGTEGNVMFAKYFNCTRSMDRVRCLFLVFRGSPLPVNRTAALFIFAENSKVPKTVSPLAPVFHPTPYSEGAFESLEGKYANFQLVSTPVVCPNSSFPRFSHNSLTGEVAATDFSFPYTQGALRRIIVIIPMEEIN